jgi:hypothetical protein
LLEPLRQDRGSGVQRRLTQFLIVLFERVAPRSDGPGQKFVDETAERGVGASESSQILYVIDQSPCPFTIRVSLRPLSGERAEIPQEVSVSR